MINTGLMWFMLLLTTIDILVIVYLIHVLKYNIEGLKFLVYAERVISENDDPEQLEVLTKKDIPLYVETIFAIKIMMYFVFATLNLGIVVFLFSSFPEIQTNILWSVISLIMLASNAFIIITIRTFMYLKISINSTCEAYNLLIQSYEYMKEYED